MELEHTLAILKDNLPMLQHLGVRSLAVFGSVARNEANPGSDIDILVDFASPPNFDQYIELKFYLEDLLGSRVDLAPQDGLRSLLREEVEQEAIYVS